MYTVASNTFMENKEFLDLIYKIKRTNKILKLVQEKDSIGLYVEKKKILQINNKDYFINEKQKRKHKKIYNQKRNKFDELSDFVMYLKYKGKIYNGSEWHDIKPFKKIIYNP